MAEETQVEANADVIDNNVSEVKFTVVDNNDNQVSNNGNSIGNSINDEYDYEELNDELAFKQLAESRGISVSELQNLLETKNNDEYIELDENVALQHLADSKGLTVDEFKDSLTPKEQKKYAPEIEGFQEYYEKTGDKNFNNYLETQKDWKSENPETVLREALRLKNPHLDKDEQDFLFNEKYGINDLDEDDDAREIKIRTINKKNDLIDAEKFLEERKEKFKGVGGSDEYIPIEYREAKKYYDSLAQQEERDNLVYQGLRNEFLAKTNQRFNDNFEGFKIKLGNDEFGYNEVAFKPDNINEARDLVSDTNNLMKDFYDENGNLTKQNELQDALYFAKHKDKLMNQAYNRGIADKIEADDKISKNIQPDNIRPQIQTGSTGVTYTKE